ncbi:MAG: hypothetical protein M1132_06580 [Chloroflexi bacterium]|nr:hypothetical protein [Chloroflexota bacterium]
MKRKSGNDSEKPNASGWPICGPWHNARTRCGQEIEVLLQKHTAQSYDQAVQLISKLPEFAALKHNKAAFQTWFNGIFEYYRTRHSLLERLRAAGLCPARETVHRG